MDNKKQAKPKGAWRKERFLRTKAYKWQVDLVEALLDDDNYYTRKQVDRLIKNYLESEVK